MFISQNTKGAPFINGLILFILMVFAVLVVLMLVKLKADPKEVGAQKFTLSLKKATTPVTGTTPVGG
jgi:hypothetical protein